MNLNSLAIPGVWCLCVDLARREKTLRTPSLEIRARFEWNWLYTLRVSLFSLSDHLESVKFFPAPFFHFQLPTCTAAPCCFVLDLLRL